MTEIGHVTGHTYRFQNGPVLFFLTILGYIDVGKLYEAFKNWETDITEEFKI